MGFEKAWTQKAEVFGVDDLRADFRQFNRTIQKDMKRAVRKATNIMLKEVRASIPDTDGEKNTGNLKKNTKTSVRGLDGRVIVGQDAFYFLSLEYGSEAGHKATEFSKKAVKRVRAQAEKELVDGLDRALDNLMDSL